MAFLGQETELRDLQDRFKFLYAGLFIALGLITTRLVYLQVFNGDQMRRYSEENRIKRVRIPAPRGMIFDRNRTLLVDNRPAFDLHIIPQYLRESGQQDEVIERLSQLVNMSPKAIKAKLRRARHQPRFMPVKIKTDLSREEVAQIETWKIDMPGVSVETEILRTNVYGDTAAHLLGYISTVTEADLNRLAKEGKDYGLGDYIGKVGIEKELENTLRGKDGLELVEVDALGRRIREQEQGRVIGSVAETPAVPGKNLVLTIDQDVQLAAKQAFGEKAGSIVAIDPNNGEILSMLSRPSFDPTEFSRGISAEIWKSLLSNPSHPLRDKTIQDHYSPGSVFKLVSAITGLEDGVIDENTVFNCPGRIRVGRRPYHCHRQGGHGNVNVVEALMYSCDIFFYRLAQKLKSVDRIADWAFKLGLGTNTDINLSREVPGLIPTEEWKLTRLKKEWTAGETLSVAIGQSFVLTTTLQLAQLYSSIANGGSLYRPHFIRAIESPDGETLDEMQPELIRKVAISPKTLKLIKTGLFEVINHPRGTAHSQRIPGLEFLGKTGTAQVIRLSADRIYQKCDEMKYRHRHHGIFAGFAPKGDPKIAVAVIAEHACSGSGGAGPIARAVVKTYMEKYHPEFIKAPETPSTASRDSKPAQTTDEKIDSMMELVYLGDLPENAMPENIQ